MTAKETLLDGLIDYAGLFPPAGLDMVSAVRNYARHRESENAWMLSRFIVPVQRLEEFTAAFAEACCDEQGVPWLLGVLSTGDADEDARYLDVFDQGAAFLDCLEIKAKSTDHARRMLADVPHGMKVFVEFDPGQRKEMLPLLSEHRACAKIRTGGLVAEAIPSIQDVAGFIKECAERKVAFKATAGLHHPLRSIQRLTCEANSPSALMHGFLNVFVAAAVAYLGTDVAGIEKVLGEQESPAVHWGQREMVFAGQRLSTELIATARDNFAISFGSCSFDEPVSDLKALGWL